MANTSWALWCEGTVWQPENSHKSFECHHQILYMLYLFLKQVFDIGVRRHSLLQDYHSLINPSASWFCCQLPMSEWGQTASATLPQYKEIIQRETCVKWWFVSTSKESRCFTTLEGPWKTGIPSSYNVQQIHCQAQKDDCQLIVPSTACMTLHSVRVPPTVQDATAETEETVHLYLLPRG